MLLLKMGTAFGGGPLEPFFFFYYSMKSYLVFIQNSSVSLILQMFGVPGCRDLVGEINKPAYSNSMTALASSISPIFLLTPLASNFFFKFPKRILFSSSTQSIIIMQRFLSWNLCFLPLRQSPWKRETPELNQNKMLVFSFLKYSSATLKGFSSCLGGFSTVQVLLSGQKMAFLIIICFNGSLCSSLILIFILLLISILFSRSFMFQTSSLIYATPHSFCSSSMKLFQRAMISQTFLSSENSIYYKRRVPRCREYSSMNLVFYCRILNRLTSCLQSQPKAYRPPLVQLILNLLLMQDARFLAPMSNLASFRPLQVISLERMPLIFSLRSLDRSKLMLQNSTIFMHLPLILISSSTQSGGFLVFQQTFSAYTKRYQPRISFKILTESSGTLEQMDHKSLISLTQSSFFSQQFSIYFLKPSSFLSLCKTFLFINELFKLL